MAKAVHFLWTPICGYNRWPGAYGGGSMDLTSTRNPAGVTCKRCLKVMSAPER